MRNKNFSIWHLIFSIVFFVTIQVEAITPTMSPTPIKEASPSSSVMKEIQQFKDRLASKVDELKKKDNKPVAGFITSIDKKTLNIKTDDETTYTVTTDDVLTKYYDISTGGKKELSLTDFSKNMYVIVSGTVNDKTINANVIYEDSHVLLGSGNITEVNKSDYYIKVAGLDKENYTIDIENNTKIYLVDSKTLELDTIGFSKIKEGDTVHFVLKVTGTEKEKNRYSAQKVLIIPQEYFIK